MPPSRDDAPSPVPDMSAEMDQSTVIFFDWDDTCLPSSFLSGQGYRLDSEHICPDLQEQLRVFELSVVSVLELAMQFGDVHIVTNAETGWVQLSAQKFIPRVVPILSKVKILSARSTYEGLFPESPLKWKFYAFQDKLSPVFQETRTRKNIISFGDSHVEREAVRAATLGLPNTRTKSVKFAERPSMEQLRRQIELVHNCFQYIHSHEGDLDLQLTVTVSCQDGASGTSAPAGSADQPTTAAGPEEEKTDAETERMADAAKAQASAGQQQAQSVKC